MILNSEIVIRVDKGIDDRVIISDTLGNVGSGRDRDIAMKNYHNDMRINQEIYADMAYKESRNNHITLGVYANGEYKYNVVRDRDLREHIEYNKTFRPGRLLYVDGVRMYNGCMKEECMEKYDKIASAFFSDNTIDISKPTIPYR